MDVSRYSFGRALRPFSFCVALVCCGLGVLLAWHQGSEAPFRSLSVILAGLLLQAGVNLINDYSDLQSLPDGPRSVLWRRQIIRNFRYGLACFTICALLAGYLIVMVGWPLFLLCLLGLAGALFYTLEPINYKRRGLGVVLVFWLMGVLMVGGAYLAVTGRWESQVGWLAVPVSLLVSLLLLSNELRDWEADAGQGIRTLTVRWGYRYSCLLYGVLIVLAYLSALIMHLAGWLPMFLPLLPALLAVPALLRLLAADSDQRRALTPVTGRFFTAFGALYMLCTIELY